MCGIAGFIGWRDQEALLRMVEQQGHRGPDGVGYFSDEDVSLGHCRLSIIDLETGDQPISNEDKTSWVVFNGEIYNYRELRKKVSEAGHSLRTQSDTEVLVHLYEMFGLQFVDSLDGMFAFALWDSKTRTLLLGRDHLGIKPLYYSILPNGIVFASSIGAILKSGLISAHLDPEALDQFLSLRYIPSRNTPVKEIFRLPPAHLLIYRDRSHRLFEYWSLPEKEMPPGDFQEVSKELSDLLKESVEMQLVGDVPVGVYLSGGLDSGAVTAIAQRASSRPLQTFSIGFGDPGDELGEAARLSRMLGTDHHEVLMTPEDFLELPMLVDRFDELIGDPVFVVLQKLARLARNQVKVVLTGEGADELFGGYVHHNLICLSQRLINIPGGRYLFRLAANMVGFIPAKVLKYFTPYPAAIGEKGRKRLKEWLTGIDDPVNSYLRIASLFSEEEKKSLYSQDYQNMLSGLLSIEVHRELSDFLSQNTYGLLNRIIRFDLTHWLPNYILLMDDKASMSFGLEARVPFLRKALVEYVSQLPSAFKISRGVNKRILREAVGEWLPPDFRNRAKRALYVPMERFVTPEFRQMALDLLTSTNASLHGIIHRDVPERLLKEFSASPLLVGKQIFALMVLELWLKRNGVG